MLPHSGILAVQGLQAPDGIEPGQHVLINGAGGCVGPFAVQIARSLGAEVTGVDTVAKLDLVRLVGAHHVIDHTREDVTAHRQRYDRILDIAATRSILAFRRPLRPGGAHVVIARSVAGLLGAIVLGAALSRATSKRMGTVAWRPNGPELLGYLASLMESGALRPVVHDRIGLADVPAALRTMETGDAYGRFMVVP